MSDKRVLYLRGIPDDLIARIDAYAQRCAVPGTKASRTAAAILLLTSALKAADRGGRAA